MLSIPQEENGRGKQRSSLDIVYWTDIFSKSSSSHLNNNAKAKAIANLGKVKKHEDTIGIYTTDESGDKHKSRSSNYQQQQQHEQLFLKQQQKQQNPTQTKGLSRSSSFLPSAKSLLSLAQHFSLSRSQNDKQKQKQQQINLLKQQQQQQQQKPEKQYSQIRNVKKESISRAKLISQYTIQDHHPNHIIRRRVSVESQSPFSSSGGGSSEFSPENPYQACRSSYNTQTNHYDYDYEYSYSYYNIYNQNNSNNSNNSNPNHNVHVNVNNPYDESPTSDSSSGGGDGIHSENLSPFGFDSSSSDSPSSADSLITCENCGRSRSHDSQLTPCLEQLSLFTSLSLSDNLNNMAPDVTKKNGGGSSGKSSNHGNHGNHHKEEYFRVDHHGYVLNRGQNLRRGPSAVNFANSQGTKDYFNCRIPRPRLKNGGIVPTHSFGMSTVNRNTSSPPSCRASSSTSSISTSCHNLTLTNNSTHNHHHHHHHSREQQHQQPLIPQQTKNNSTNTLLLTSPTPTPTTLLMVALESDSVLSTSSSLSARVRRKGQASNSHENSIEHCLVEHKNKTGGGREDNHKDSSVTRTSSTSLKVSPQISSCDRHQLQQLSEKQLLLTRGQSHSEMKIQPPTQQEQMPPKSTSAREGRFWGVTKKSLSGSGNKTIVANNPNINNTTSNGDISTRRANDHVEFLKTVPVFRKLSNAILGKLGEHIKEANFDYGDYILFEGDVGDKFFIISSGKVQVTMKSEERYREIFVRTLYPGDFFGEIALLGNNQVRSANVIADDKEGVVCLILSAQVYDKYLRPIKEFRTRYSESPSNTIQDISIQQPQHQQLQQCDRSRRKLNEDLENIELDDLRIVTTLGVGGFGRVELVTLASDNSRSFALKQMKKSQIVATRQVEHIKSEKSIMFEANCEFICKLYKTFRDSQYLYMMMECCLGGELWTILRDRGYFDDKTTLFYAGCVLEALRYLHSRNIIYRDLKPENLLLDSSGYVKLVDFGFAKRLQQDKKTWTFCGTPEYVAPEVIMNKGHGLTADYWSFGVLLHELLTGSPPFQGGDPVKTYRIILKGMSSVMFPSTISREAESLIRKLCRDNPAERLGSQRGGILDIQKHKWFDGFNWPGLRARSISPPILPEIKGPLDSGNFDHYESDMNGPPPIDLSGWDEDF